MRLIVVVTLLFCMTVQASLRSRPINLDEAKAQVAQYYESGAFEEECAEIIDKALRYLQEHENMFNEQKTVVFDIDDTILLFYRHFKEHNFGHHCFACGHNPYVEWVEKADAAHNAPVKRLYDYCVMHGYHIVFLSGRFEQHKQATLDNLAKHGYTAFDALMLKTEAEKKVSAAALKAAKRKIMSESGLQIVACVGDQSADFVGEHVGYAVRIPNYLYVIA